MGRSPEVEGFPARLKRVIARHPDAVFMVGLLLFAGAVFDNNVFNVPRKEVDYMPPSSHVAAEDQSKRTVTLTGRNIADAVVGIASLSIMALPVWIRRPKYPPQHSV